MNSTKLKWKICTHTHTHTHTNSRKFQKAKFEFSMLPAIYISIILGIVSNLGVI